MLCVVVCHWSFGLFDSIELHNILEGISLIEAELIILKKKKISIWCHVWLYLTLIKWIDENQTYLNFTIIVHRKNRVRKIVKLNYILVSQFVSICSCCNTHKRMLPVIVILTYIIFTAIHTSSYGNAYQIYDKPMKQNINVCCQKSLTLC